MNDEIKDLRARAREYPKDSAARHMLEYHADKLELSSLALTDLVQALEKSPDEGER